MPLRKPFAYLLAGCFAFCVAAVVSYFNIWPAMPAGAEDASDLRYVDAERTAVPETDAFGLGLDLTATEAKIPRNATFSTILTGFDVTARTIHNLALASKEVFDVRYIQAGKRYRIYRDSTDAVRHVVYQQDRVNYVVYTFTDSVTVRAGKRPVVTRIREAEGVITSSLYETLLAADVRPELAIDLSEVFAWQIDFYRVQPGDHFKVIYEEKLVDDAVVGIGQIQAARFTHMGEAYYAFHFDQEGKEAYFDEDGESLRKAFLVSPVKYARLSSRYSRRRFHPVQKRYKAHLGTDYAAPRGTAIRATGDGIVEAAQYKRYNGNYVKVRHNGTYTTGYLHMSKFAPGIKPGTRVQQGDIIGYVGSTGLATGPHVCYRFWKNGSQVDPLREDFPSAEPVRDELQAAFARHRDLLLFRLERDGALPLAGL